MRSHFLRAAQKAGDAPDSPFELVGQSTVGTSTSGATISAAIPDGTQAGDFILVVHTAYAITALDMSLSDISYNKAAELYANNTYDSNLGVHWKISDGTEDIIALPGGSGFRTASCAIQVWRGIDPAHPLDVAPVSDAGAGTWKAISPGISTVTPGALVVLSAGVTISSAATLVAPSGFSDETIYNSGGTISARSAIASKYSPQSGVSLGGQWESSTSGSQFSWCACTLALRPA